MRPVAGGHPLFLLPYTRAHADALRWPLRLPRPLDVRSTSAGRPTDLGIDFSIGGAQHRHTDHRHRDGGDGQPPFLPSRGDRSCAHHHAQMAACRGDRSCAHQRGPKSPALHFSHKVASTLQLQLRRERERLERDLKQRANLELALTDLRERNRELKNREPPAKDRAEVAALKDNFQAVRAGLVKVLDTPTRTWSPSAQPRAFALRTSSVGGTQEPERERKRGLRLHSIDFEDIKPLASSPWHQAPPPDALILREYFRVRTLLPTGTWIC